MCGCVPDSRQTGSIRCISSSFLFNNGTFCHFITVTSRIQWGPGIYGLWPHVHIGFYVVRISCMCRRQSVTPTARIQKRSDTQLHQPSLQSYLVAVVNSAARGVSLLVCTGNVRVVHASSALSRLIMVCKVSRWCSQMYPLEVRPSHHLEWWWTVLLAHWIVHSTC